MRRAGPLAYREEGSGEDVIVFLHGYPESSYLWRHQLAAAAEAGWRAIAPDLPGFGDSPVELPGTWERFCEAFEAFYAELGVGRVVLAVHDWGGFVGLRFACDHPDAVRGLVISPTGFFSDGRWHGIAEAMRTPGQGEELVANMTREGLGAILRQQSAGMEDDVIDEFWKCFGDEDRRQMQLDFYRSMDFEKLEPYQGCLGRLGVPALLLWGENDAFAPVGGAHRFQREIPGARLVVLEGAGHWLGEDQPERAREELVRFLRDLR